VEEILSNQALWCENLSFLTQAIKKYL